MTNRPDPIGEAGLQFFGRMSASISHELKNALAIIKENAGLLGDYIHLMDKGSPVDPDRFRTIAQRIDGQTRRADDIIKDLNRFAHTVDSTCKPVDLNQTLDLLAALHRRSAGMRQLTLETQPADPAVVITTAPFLLLNALGLILGTVISLTAPGARLTVAAKPTSSGAEICFMFTGTLPDLLSTVFAGVPEDALLTALGAQAIIEQGQSRIIVQVPLRP